MELDSTATWLFFGSRAGTLTGLAVFVFIVGTIAAAAASSAGRGRLAAGLGVSVFVGLMGLVYVSSFGGFYEAEVGRDSVTLHYLIDPRMKRIPLDSIREVRPCFAYKLRWRLDIETTAGERYSSATDNGQAIRLAADRLNDALGLDGGGA